MGGGGMARRVGGGGAPPSGCGGLGGSVTSLYSSSARFFTALKRASDCNANFATRNFAPSPAGPPPVASLVNRYHPRPGKRVQNELEDVGGN